MKVRLVVAASKHGASSEIAERIGSELEERAVSRRWWRTQATSTRSTASGRSCWAARSTPATGLAGQGLRRPVRRRPGDDPGVDLLERAGW